MSSFCVGAAGDAPLNSRQKKINQPKPTRKPQNTTKRYSRQTPFSPRPRQLPRRRLTQDVNLEQLSLGDGPQTEDGLEQERAGVTPFEVHQGDDGDADGLLGEAFFDFGEVVVSVGCFVVFCAVPEVGVEGEDGFTDSRRGRGTYLSKGFFCSEYVRAVWSGECGRM